jgi:hypothetical protein
VKTDTKPTFIHNGVTITLEDNGRFTAEGPTGRITSGSLEGIKKRLDKDGVFTPFKAFSFNNGYYRVGELQEFTVVGIAEPRRRYGARQWKVIEGEGGRTIEKSEVYEDTPANRAAAMAYLAMVKEHRKVRDEQELQEQKALAKMVARLPEKKSIV